jgi:hypothetical protein
MGFGGLGGLEMRASGRHPCLPVCFATVTGHGKKQNIIAKQPGEGVRGAFLFRAPETIWTPTVRRRSIISAL